MISKLLFITQKVDLDDDLLGVYHRWIEGLAAKFEKISVICLYQGREKLPANVAVYSLGKEVSSSRIKYLKNFYRYIWQLRKDYDAVFVHMNPEYLILGGFLWKLWGKRLVFWYAHYLANLKLRLAALFPDTIVTSTRLAYPLKSKKLLVLQQGIDTERFRPLKLPITPPAPTRLPDGQGLRRAGNYQLPITKFKILFLGRIAPVKHIEVLLQALAALKNSGRQSIILTIVGEPTVGKPDEFKYYENLKKLAQELNLTDLVTWRPRVANYETPKIFNEHDLFINLTDTGSFDKSTLEAMACGLPVIVSNKAFLEIFPDVLFDSQMFQEKNSEDLAKKIQGFLALSIGERENISREMRRLIIEKHSLSGFTEKLTQAIKGL